MGHIWKALEKGFSEMHGLGRGGWGSEPYFFKSWPLPLTVVSTRGALVYCLLIL